MNYFDEQAHRGWLYHYTDGYDDGSHKLLFTEAFRDRMPGDGECVFTINHLDRLTGRLYAVHAFYVSYDHSTEYVQDAITFEVTREVESLQSYFYGSHHCACHRKDDVTAAGCPDAFLRYDGDGWDSGTGDSDCHGDRFAIHSITWAGLPGVILYSETMSVEDLEMRLAGHAAIGALYQEASP